MYTANNVIKASSAVNKFLKYLLSLIVICLLTSCGAIKRSAMEKISQISVTDFKIESVQPHGLRAMTVGFSMTIDNPAMKIKLEEIVLTIVHNDAKTGTTKELAYMYIDPILLPKESESVHHLVAEIELAPRASLLDIMSILSSANKEGTMVVITADATGANIVRKKLNQTIALKDLI